MPKAILEFDLPTEQAEFETAIKAHDWKYAMWDLDQWLRNEIKYHDKDYQKVRDQLWEVLQDRDLNLDE